tara:strand:- start:19 stop:462 length:444 start_codon:yes stop_codon:yes gene_type:complete
MNIYNFLSEKEPDFSGRYITDIWNFNDFQIENIHNFIQILFPLNKPSKAVFHSYYLKKQKEIDEIKKSQTIQNNLIKSKEWYLNFLKRTNKWRNYTDHNHLRITRIIECLRLLVSDLEADSFYNSVLSILNFDNQINKKTLEIWSRA